MTGPADYLKELESLYLALADRTRLRLLNLMKHGETCVCFFSEVLGDSQPKVSRHLAYLRGAGLVETRREGKWVHYSIRWPEDDGRMRILSAALGCLDGLAQAREDVERYREICGSPERLAAVARSPMPFIEQKLGLETTSAKRPLTGPAADGVATDDAFDPGGPGPSERGFERSAAHNELEEFLL
ncbi:MAG: ArsR/SmtB family transcription factor [Pyrinomonadaceae bacterium]